MFFIWVSIFLSDVVEYLGPVITANPVEAFTPAVREVQASRHNGGPIEGSFKPLDTIEL